MIKHIVLWTLKDHAEGKSKAENAALAKQYLEALNGKIPGTIKIEVGIDISQSSDSADLLLYSEFESQQALKDYHQHPEHQKLIPFMQAIRLERRLVDYDFPV